MLNGRAPARHVAPGRDVISSRLSHGATGPVTAAQRVGVALESAIGKLHRAHIFVAMAGVRPGPRAVLERAGMREEPGKLAICSDDDEALLVVRLYLGLGGAAPGELPAEREAAHTHA